MLRGRVRQSTDRLIATTAALSDADIAGPSLLPGWTRGHVLAHVARNADALANLLEWARTGTPRPAYPSPQARVAGIESGAPRPVAEQVADLRAAGERFDDLAATVTGPGWQTVLDLRGAPAPAWHVLWRRWREVEVHHVDLNAGYTPADWSPEFGAALLDEVATGMSGRDGVPPLRLRAEDSGRSFDIGPAGGAPLVHGSSTALAAWLAGRSRGEGLTADGPLPAIPEWI